MASNLCLSASSLYRPLLFNSISSLPRDLKPRSSTSNAFKLPTLSPQSKPHPRDNFYDPDGRSSSASSSKSYARVKSRSSKLRKDRKETRHIDRYSSLVKAAETLNTCKAIEGEVHRRLRNSGLGDNFSVEDAVVVMNKMRKPGTALLAIRYFVQRFKTDREDSVTVEALKKCRGIIDVVKVFDEMLDRELSSDNVFTFTVLITCTRLGNRPRQAVYWFEKMLSLGITPDQSTYSAMIDVYHRAGNVEKALSLYERAKAEKWRLDNVTFSALIKIHTYSWTPDECLNVCDEMKALGVEPEVETFNALMYAMTVQKRPWTVSMIYKDMIDRGVKPNFRTYSRLLGAYCEVLYGKEAISVYREMKEKGMKLGQQHYNMLLSLCASLCYADEAAEIFEHMKSSKVEIDSRSFHFAITAFSSCGKVSEAASVLSLMIEAGFEPDLLIFTSLIQSCGIAGQIDNIVKIFNIVLELGLTPDERFCGYLVSAVAQSPVEEVGELVECIDRGNPNLGYVVKLLIQGDQDNEVNFWELVSDLFNSITSDGAKKTICNSLIDLCLNLESYLRACELLDVALTLKVYTDIQARSPTQWTLDLKDLSHGAALTALQVWINDLSNEMEYGESIPDHLGISTGNGQFGQSEKSLPAVINSHLKAIGSPFRESPDKNGWFFAPKADAEAWLEARKEAQVA